MFSHFSVQNNIHNDSGFSFLQQFLLYLYSMHRELPVLI